MKSHRSKSAMVALSLWIAAMAVVIPNSIFCDAFSSVEQHRRPVVQQVRSSLQRPRRSHFVLAMSDLTDIPGMASDGLVDHAMILNSPLLVDKLPSTSSILHSSLWMADAVEVDAAASMIANDTPMMLAIGISLASLAGLTVLALETTKATASISVAPQGKDNNVIAPTVERIAESTNISVVDESEKEELEKDDQAFRGGSDNDDEWVAKGKEATQAFQSGNRGKLRKVIGDLLRSIRSAQSDLKSERELREAAQADLKIVGEKFRDLEDQYELEQNQLTKTTKTLEDTKVQLRSTQKALNETTSTLVELQEERKSLRRLGRVAWNLSKDRVQTRWQKLRSRLRRESSNNE